jgi:hypothetical protein
MDGRFNAEPRLAPFCIWPHKYIYGRYQKFVGDKGSEGFTSFDLFGHISQAPNLFEEEENPR